MVPSQTAVHLTVVHTKEVTNISLKDTIMATNMVNDQHSERWYQLKRKQRISLGLHANIAPLLVSPNSIGIQLALETHENRFKPDLRIPLLMVPMPHSWPIQKTKSSADDPHSGTRVYTCTDTHCH